MAVTIADLIKMEKLNIPKTILSNDYEALIGKIVLIYSYELESSDEEGNTRTIEANQSQMGRLLSIKDNICKFQRKDGSTFRIDIRDIREMKLFISKNYRACEQS